MLYKLKIFISRFIFLYITPKYSKDLRESSCYYLKGSGIEIGALHNPLKVPQNLNVKYVDRMDVHDLRSHYPELANLNLVNVDIIDNGEELHTIQNDSLDFIIANHMLEHTINPIQTIENHIQKLKKGGILYYAIPDKRYTFDKERELTSFEHLLLDYKKEADDFLHFLEYAKFCENITDEEEQLKRAKQLSDLNYSIHFHVWTTETFIDFINKTNSFLSNKSNKNKFKFKFSVQNNDEAIMILKKL